MTPEERAYERVREATARHARRLWLSRFIGVTVLGASVVFVMVFVLLVH